MDAQHEPVQLRFRQRISAFLLDGILRGDDEEWRRERVGFAVHRHGKFLHGFEERGLGFRRRAVDFVGEQQIGENRAAMKNQRAALATFVSLQNLRAGDVRRHEVGRELDAPEIPAKQIGERLHHHRFGEAGHPDHERMAAGEQARQQQANHLVLTDEDRTQLFLQGLAAGAQASQRFLRRFDFAIHNSFRIF